MDCKPTISEYAKENRDQHRNLLHSRRIQKSTYPQAPRDYELKYKRHGREFLLRVAAALTAVATTITTCKHFAVDKLGKIADKVLVFACSERVVEKGLHFDRFHGQLHKREAVNM